MSQPLFIIVNATESPLSNSKVDKLNDYSRGMHRNKSCYIVFPGNQVKTVACHDAQRDSRFRTDCINGIRENFQPHKP